MTRDPVLTPTQEKLAVIGKAEFGVKRKQKRAKAGRRQRKRATRAVRKKIKHPGARRGATRGRANKVAHAGKNRRPRKLPKRKAIRRRVVKRRAPPVRKGRKRNKKRRYGRRKVSAHVRKPSDAHSDIQMPEVLQPIIDIPPPNFLIRFWQPFTFLAALTTYWLYNV